MTETKKVNIELEVDTNVVDSSKNKYQSWIDITLSYCGCMENIFLEYSLQHTFIYYTK